MKDADSSANNGRENRVIEVKDLTVGYGDDVVLEKVNFSVKRGEIFVVLGGSGCGKSTLLKHLIGLYRPIQGSVSIDGRDLVSSEGEERRTILSRLGVMYQSGALFGSMTLGQNVCLPLEEFTSIPRDGRELIAWSKLKLVGLEEFIESYPAEISGGMQKRAAIARAMALDPDILFLDEPSAGLDPLTAASIDVLVKKLNEILGLTFVIVTHELPSIFSIADRVIMLDSESKSIIAEGAPRELKEHSPNEMVRRFFNREV